MLQRLLHFFWRSPRPARSLPQLLSAPEEARPGPGSLVRINVEAWDPAEQHALHTVAAETAKITFYTGKVQHGYALSVVMTPERCPRCRAGTRQHYANFIYATQTAPRVLFAPAGYFCTRCPTVVIDEEMVRAGMTASFTFHGVVGIAYDDRDAPDYFLTWNGQHAVYLLNEDQMLEGLATLPPAQQRQRQHSNKHKRQARQRLAKASRRRNRP